MAKIKLENAAVDAWLRERYTSVSDVEPLTGGAWSRAFGFVADERSLVGKFGQYRDDYERDALAGSWRVPGAPTPCVVEVAVNCPNERAVNHGDPLWGNILIDDDDGVVALLDWGVSVVGDPLYDFAMLLFCCPWKPAIDAARVRVAACRRAGTSDIHERLRASMLNIGLDTLQYQAFAGLTDDLTKTAAWVEEILRDDGLDQRAHTRCVAEPAPPFQAHRLD